MGIVSSLMEKIDLGVTATVESSFGAVGTALEPFLLGFGAIFLILYAYSVMNDRQNFAFSDFALQIIKIIIIINLFRSWAFFDQIYQLLSNGGAQIGGFFLQAATGSSDTIYVQFDNLITFILNIASTAASKGGTFNLMPAIIGAFVGILAAFLAAAAVVIMAVAKIGLGVAISLAPIVILTLYFKGTSGFFEKWIAWGVTFALVPIIVAGILGLVIVAANGEATSANNGVTDTIGGAMGIVTIVCSAIYFLLQVPEYAGQLAGGAALSGLGRALGSGAKNTASTARGAMIAVGAGAGYVAGKATGAAANASSASGAGALTKTAAVAQRVQSIANKGSTLGLHHQHPRRSK
ncbi:MAG: type IV secretion system protein [Rhizobiaceae bacterium]